MAEKKGWNAKCVGNLICANILTHLREVLASPFIKINAIHPLKWCVVCQKSIPSAGRCQEQQRWTGNRSPWTRPFRKKKLTRHRPYSLIISGKYNWSYFWYDFGGVRQFHGKVARVKCGFYMEVIITHLSPHCYFNNFTGFWHCIFLAQDYPWCWGKSWPWGNFPHKHR